MSLSQIDISIILISRFFFLQLRGLLSGMINANRFSLPTVQSFPTLEEANAFLTGTRLPGSQNTASSGADNTRFYGVQRGHKPGVYTDWAKAQEQIRGFVRPKYKKFSTRVEAEEFVRSGQEQPSTSVSISQVKELPGSAGLTSDNPKDDLGFDLEPGTGPLPPGAEDGFDPNVLFDPTTGRIVYKTKEQKTATKTRPTGSPPMLNIYTDGSSLRNGSKIASAGVGVYFGPGDKRHATLFLSFLLVQSY